MGILESLKRNYLNRWTGYTNRFVDNVPTGLRNLTLTKPGYQAKTVTVDVPAGLKVLAPMTLDPV